MTAAKKDEPLVLATRKGLHAKLAEVMAEAERIPKNGKAPAAMGGFGFVQVGDAADFIRKALASRGISMLPTSVEILGQNEHTTKSGGTMTTVELRTTWTLTDGETGQSAVIQSYGAGADSGDKFSGKAQTNAMKYALLMGFLLSTGDDPELADSSDRRKRSQSDRPVDPSGEELRSLGVITRAGAIGKGDGRHSRLEARQTPDGMHVGWRLELGDGKAIPQVYADGTLGHALLFAYGNDPERLFGEPVTVTGELFEVHQEGRRMYHRLHVAEIETPVVRIPPRDDETPDPIPPEAEPVLSFELTDDEKAAIGAGASG